ncbi:MAG: PhnD/SsuA/transferrin family substrate-binding protein [Acidimicrobiia bacterium]|nr:PhnD/SsuA/transferrin family substrate-binding protein [Acidimicrobiia bacterium]
MGKKRNLGSIPTVGVWLVAFALVLGACGGANIEDDPDPGSTTTATPAPSDGSTTGSSVAEGEDNLKRDLVVAYSAVPQLAYSASRTAWREMNKQGWEIEELFLPQNELAIQALEQGEVDLVPTSTLTGMIAINQGADIVGIVAAARGEWVLVGAENVETPADLEGKRIAVHSETSVSNLVVEHSLSKEGINAEVVMIPGSPARAQALTQGEVDATSLFISDALRLEADADMPINIVANYADLPFIDQMLFVRRSFLTEHRGEAEAVVKGLLDTYRRFQEDPAWGALQANLLLPETPVALAERVVEVHNEIGVWSPTGGVADYDDFAETIAFLKSAELLPVDASDDPTAFIDLDILDSVRG